MDRISVEQVHERLKAENPWWGAARAPIRPADDLIPRPYIERVYPLITERNVRRAVVMLGPRRVGKTVLLHHAIRRLLNAGTNPWGICYIAVDHPVYNGLRMDDFLHAFEQVSEIKLASGEHTIFFDEIQYLREWEVHLKAAADSYPNCKFIVSGSSAAALRLKSRESGAGRFTDFMLPPLTFYEYLNLTGSSDLVGVEESAPSTADIATLNETFVRYLNFGGYPEVALSREIQKDPARFVKNDIIDKVLLRDLPSLYGIQDIQELNYLFTSLAYNTAQEVTLEELSSGSGVSKVTIRRYIEYLEAAFLIRLLHRVDRGGKRFTRANFFKVYLSNPSMRSALFAPIDSEHPAMGFLVETGIVAQWFHQTRIELHYARWKDGEVDLVSVGPDLKIDMAVEAKWSDRYLTRLHELSGLVRFCQRNGLKAALVTTRTQARTVHVDNVALRFTPAALYAFEIGYKAIHDAE